MRTPFLLKLADAGLFSRRLERVARERHFRSFWAHVGDDAPPVSPSDREQTAAEGLEEAPYARRASASR